MTIGFSFFDTAIGQCGVVWSEHGIARVQLPEAGAAQARALLLRRHPGATQAAPAPAIRLAIERVTALLDGEAADLSAVVLDMQGLPPFHRRVYELARSIPPGATCAYGDIARRLGAPGSARAVGQALGANPFTLVVPCHRVLAANGRLGGFSAHGGIVIKLRLLAIEAAATGAPGALFAGDGVLGCDLALAVEHLRASSPAMARLIDAVGPCRLQLTRTPDIFQVLARAIVYQQLTGRAAATIHARVCALFPHAHEGPVPERILRISDARLRAAGLSGSKSLALKDLARKCVDGEIPALGQLHAMEDEAIVECLTRVRGIGRWTVEMLLMFRLGRADILPLGDYGVLKGYALAFGKRKLPSPAELAQAGLNWQPYRTVASWYFWRAVDAARD